MLVGKFWNDPDREPTLVHGCLSGLLLIIVFPITIWLMITVLSWVGLR